MFFTLVWHFCVVWYNFSEFFLIRMPFQIKITVFTYSLESGRADGFLFLRRKISYIICYFLFLLNYLPWKRPHTEARVFSAGANRLWVCRLYLNVLSKNIYKNHNNNKKIEKYFQKRLRVPWETLSLTEIKSVITFNTNRKKDIYNLHRVSALSLF